MKVDIHGKNLEITDAIRNAVNKSLVKIEKFKTFIKEDTSIKIEIRSYSENIYKVSANIFLPHQKNIHCEEKNSDLYVAIKNIVHPLERQLRHIKEDYYSNSNESVTESFVQQEEEEINKYIADLEDEETF